MHMFLHEYVNPVLSYQQRFDLELGFYSENTKYKDNETKHMQTYRPNCLMTQNNHYGY